MIYINKATLVGTLAQAPAIRTSKNGKQYCTFKVAIVKKSWGDTGYNTNEIEVTAYGKTCETLINNVNARLGNQCLVECDISSSAYTDKTGTARYNIGLIATWVQFDESGTGVRPDPNFEDDVPMF